MDKKYYCRNCNGLRNYKSLFEKKNKGSEEEGYFEWIDQYNVIECAGCETISFLHEYGDNYMIKETEEGHEYYTDVTIFPFYLENGTEISEIHLLPKIIQTVYLETLNAFKSKCYMLTAGGYRAIIEALCNHLKIRKDDLSVRINLLNEKGYLTINESKRLHSIRFLGNDSLHEMEVPKPHQLLIVLEIINHLLTNLFIHDKKIANRIDVMIDKYEDFQIYISKLIKDENIGKEVSLNDFLGKSKRLFKKSDLIKFEETLIAEINDGKYNLISFIQKDEKSISKFKIEKKPEFTFDW